MAFYQCRHCELSQTSLEKNKLHEEICNKNNKTLEERFKAKVELSKEGRIKLNKDEIDSDNILSNER